MSISIATEPTVLKVDKDDVVRVGNTRVTLDIIIEAFWQGETAEEIVQQYSSLNLADIYAVLGYYLRHRSEIDVYLQRRQQQSEKARRQNESRFDPQGVRARLLARSSHQGA